MISRFIYLPLINNTNLQYHKVAVRSESEEIIEYNYIVIQVPNAK